MKPAAAKNDASTQTVVSTTKTDSAVRSPFQVIFLPDFEEQYAVRNKNFLAKTQYKYNLSHGTQLDTISGSYSAVDVPVAIIETLGARTAGCGDPLADSPG